MAGGQAQAGFLRGISSVGQKRQEEEEGAQHVLSFNHPGDGLNVQRVPGEQAGHNKTAPQGASDTTEEQKQQESIRSVESQVREVMPAGSQAKELNIQDMGEPGQRMPIVGVADLKRPRKVLPPQAG